MSHRGQLAMPLFDDAGRPFIDVYLPMLEFGPGRTHTQAAVPLDDEAQDWRRPVDVFHAAEKFVAFHAALVAASQTVPVVSQGLVEAEIVGNWAGWHGRQQFMDRSHFLLAILSIVSKKPANLGVVDGRLAPCPNSPNCVSTQATDAGHHMEPIPFDDQAIERLKTVIGAMPRMKIVKETKDYIHAEATSRLF